MDGVVCQMLCARLWSERTKTAHYDEHKSGGPVPQDVNVAMNLNASMNIIRVIILVSRGYDLRITVGIVLYFSSAIYVQ